MKYFIEDTTLTDIADAVREKEESTQPIPVVELAGRIRDIRSGAEIGVTLNDDGTQNLFITETGDLPDLAAITADADAEAEDVLYGKTFYAMGVKKVGSFNMKPDLLWENPDPTSSFLEQTVALPTGYSAYLVEYRQSNTVESLGVAYVSVPSSSVMSGGAGSWNGVTSSGSAYWTARFISSCDDGFIQFGQGFVGYKSLTSGSGSGSANNGASIPTRIWGVNFTL